MRSVPGLGGPGPKWAGSSTEVCSEFNLGDSEPPGTELEYMVDI